MLEQQPVAVLDEAIPRRKQREARGPRGSVVASANRGAAATQLQHASSIANVPAWRPLTVTVRSSSSSVSCKNTSSTSVVDLDNIAEKIQRDYDKSATIAPVAARDRCVPPSTHGHGDRARPAARRGALTDGFDPTGEYYTFSWAIESNLMIRTLVGYNHVAGPAGNMLVPDIATAVPRPTDGGRPTRSTSSTA